MFLNWLYYFRCLEVEEIEVIVQTKDDVVVSVAGLNVTILQGTDHGDRAYSYGTKEYRALFKSAIIDSTNVIQISASDIY